MFLHVSQITTSILPLSMLEINMRYFTTANVGPALLQNDYQQLHDGESVLRKTPVYSFIHLYTRRPYSLGPQVKLQQLRLISLIQFVKWTKSCLRVLCLFWMSHLCAQPLFYSQAWWYYLVYRVNRRLQQHRFLYIFFSCPVFRMSNPIHMYGFPTIANEMLLVIFRIQIGSGT